MRYAQCIVAKTSACFFCIAVLSFKIAYFLKQLLMSFKAKEIMNDHETG